MLRDFKTIIVLGLLLLGVTSCAPKPPYEVKSPCVAVETNNPWAVNHCVRRAANSLRAIA